MNSLVDEYLLFISNAITKCSKIILDDELIADDKLTDITYDYLNEVFLLNKNVGSINFSETLKLKLSQNENSLFNLFIQYGLTDRIKLKNKDIKKSYIFLVDTINYFAVVFKYICRKADFFYSQVFDSILKKEKFLDKTYLKEKLVLKSDQIKKEIETIHSTMKKINSQVESFSYDTFKITKENLLVKVSYKNESIYDYNEREVAYVIKEFERDIYIASIENLSMDIINDLFDGKKNKYFIYIPDYILSSKTYLNKVLKIFSIYSLNSTICLIFDAKSYIKLKDATELLKDYSVGIHIGESDDDDLSYQSVDYMIIDYDDYNSSLVDKYKKKATIIINGRLQSGKKEELMEKGIEYFTSNMVIS